MLGTRQSGLATFRVARLPEDAELLERARRRADQLVEVLDEQPLLEWALQAAYGADVLAPIPA
jgi:ATP-dependent DNA helicase RecG